MDIEASEWIKASFSPEMKSLRDLYDFYEATTCESAEQKNHVGLFAIVGSWDFVPPSNDDTILHFFENLLGTHQRKSDTFYKTGIVQADQSEEDMHLFCDGGTEDCDHIILDKATTKWPCPPEYLPLLVLIIRRSSMAKPEVKYLSSLKAGQILHLWQTSKRFTFDGGDGPFKNAQREIVKALHSFGLLTMEGSDSTGLFGKLRKSSPISAALRIFIAGDRMSVGKTSVCLGILGSLIQKGYPPEKLAYIKPATQNESPQLLQRYCEKMGIACIPIGPIVYYRGFTRAFLAGDTETSNELLQKVESAVDNLARDKDVVVIDGVGFPAVGSICGTDNASVALASSYPAENTDGKIHRKPLGVVLVGGPGVGSAVDAFNLNATYFERADIPVLGAIFNKLSLEGFYSLENCNEQISLYFARNDHQRRHNRTAFGFCPLFPKLGGSNAMDHVHEYARVFGDHVQIDALLDKAYDVQQRPVKNTVASLVASVAVEPSPKRQRVGEKKNLTRKEIENAAIVAGAAPSA